MSHKDLEGQKIRGLEDSFPFPGVYSQVPALNLPGCNLNQDFVSLTHLVAEIHPGSDLAGQIFLEAGAPHVAPWVVVKDDPKKQGGTPCWLT